MASQIRRTFRFRNQKQFRAAVGPGLCNLSPWKDQGIAFSVKGNTLTILDGPFDVLKECSESLNLWHQTVAAGGQIEMAPRTGSPVQLDSASGSTTSRKRSFGVKPKNEAQREYLEMIREETLTLGIGSAGTGKSFLAVAAAVQALEAKEVEKIIVTRPAVESGEKLGFLPGTADEKMDPYLFPIWDALNSIIGKQGTAALRKSGRLEIAPVAFLRGRTFNDSFVIVDEAQNCTWKQLLMIVTRIGQNCKCVITGDVDQSDLAHGQSGLESLADLIEDMPGVGIFEFDSSEVVRHPLVARILDAVREKDPESAKGL